MQNTSADWLTDWLLSSRLTRDYPLPSSPQSHQQNITFLANVHICWHSVLPLSVSFLSWAQWAQVSPELFQRLFFLPSHSLFSLWSAQFNLVDQCYVVRQCRAFTKPIFHGPQGHSSILLYFLRWHCERTDHLRLTCVCCLINLNKCYLLARPVRRQSLFTQQS